MKVTILIPTYNRATMLREAVRSALAQTCSSLEVLILDDASTDGTSTVGREAAELDARVRYIRHPENLGIAANWREGLRLAQGEFFCILHDDDTFEPQFVQSLLDTFENNPDQILAFSDHWVTDAQGRRLPAESDAASVRFKRNQLGPGLVRDLARTALIDLSIPVGASLFRRAFAGPELIDERAKGAIDMWLLYRCAASGHRASYVPQRLMNYRSHGGGMTASMPFAMTEGYIYTLRAAMTDPVTEPFRNEARRRLGECLRGYGVLLLKSGRWSEARKTFRESLQERLAWKGLAGWIIATLCQAWQRLRDSVWTPGAIMKMNGRGA
jgi:glycosyltransferase involved in cell wall biosynthesis